LRVYVGLLYQTARLVVSASTRLIDGGLKERQVKHSHNKTMVRRRKTGRGMSSVKGGRSQDATVVNNRRNARTKSGTIPAHGQEK
jgi:hypothetical protein